MITYLKQISNTEDHAVFYVVYSDGRDGYSLACQRIAVSSVNFSNFNLPFAEYPLAFFDGLSSMYKRVTRQEMLSTFLSMVLK